MTMVMNLSSFAIKFLRYFLFFYGMAAIHEETVAFIEATDWLKDEKSIDYGEVGDKIGLTRSQLNMVRIRRRKIKIKEVDKLLQHYPEVSHFFKNTSLIANEPMETYLNGGSNPNTLKELLEIQRKYIAKLEEENRALVEKNQKMEGENKALKEILSAKK